MSKSTLKDHRPPAIICREKGWDAGTLLAGDEGYGVTVIEITAIGKDRILARCVSHDGRSCHRSEGAWTLDCRDWQQVTDPQSNSKEA